MGKYVVEATSGGNRTDAGVRRVGEFDTRDEAIACAIRVIDASLLRLYQDGMAPGALFACYQADGDQPTVFQDDASTLNLPGFNPLHYARQRCRDYCGRKD